MRSAAASFRSRKRRSRSAAARPTICGWPAAKCRAIMPKSPSRTAASCCATGTRATAPTSTANRSPSASWSTATASASAAPAAPRWCSCSPITQPPVDRATTTAIGDLRQIAALLEGPARARLGPRARRRAGAGAGFGDRGERRRARLHHAGGADRRARVQDGARRGAAPRCPAAASRPAARFPRRCSAPASRASSPTCSTATSPTCTWAPSRSASATCSACRCAWCATSTRPRAVGEERRIGVLYLDSREKGSLLLRLHARGARDAGHRSGRRHRERAPLSRDDGEGADGAGDADRGRDPAGAAAQSRRGPARYFRAAAASLPCRSIGGDFYDYVDLSDGSLGFALGDVAGKGPPAALLSAMMQGIFAAQAATSDSPSQTITPGQPRALPPRHRVAVRDADVRRRSTPDGRLLYCNAGHNPPLVVGTERRSGGSSAAGRSSACSKARPTKRRRSRSTPGDWLIVFSDGVSEAMSADRRRVRRSADPRRASQRTSTLEPPGLLEALFADVRDFARGAAQSDDITAMVLRYGPS